MRALLVATCLVLAGCGRDAGEPPRVPSGDAETPPVSIKAQRAAELVNARLRPVNDTTRTGDVVDEMAFDIEIQSLDETWRWSETARRRATDGAAAWGLVEDLIYSVSPADLVRPVEIVREDNGRAHIRLVCRADPCIRATGSRVEATGSPEEVDAAMAAPEPMDAMRPDNFWPFARAEEAEQAAAAINELLAIQGAAAE